MRIAGGEETLIAIIVSFFDDGEERNKCYKKRVDAPDNVSTRS